MPDTATSSVRFMEANGVTPAPAAIEPPSFEFANMEALAAPIAPLLQTVALQVDQSAAPQQTDDTVEEAQAKLDRAVDGGSIRGIEWAAQNLDLARGQQVEASADRIEDLLDADGVFQWVSRGEVIDAADELSRHDAETTNAIFDELEQRDLIDDFAREAYDAGHVGGGIPEDQRREFFDEFAQKLSGQNLAALSMELKEVSNFGGKDTVGELSEAIAEHASDDVKIDYVLAMKGETTVNDGDNSYFAWIDTEGEAIARVIASIEDPENTEHALALLSDDELASVVNSGTDRFVFINGVIDNSEVYIDLAEAIEKIDSSTGSRGPDQIERFLHASADRLRNDRLTRSNNPEFKDALGEVFTEHLENLVGEALTQSGAIKDSFGQDIETISQHVLFSSPPGEKQGDHADEVSSLISSWINEAQTGSPTDRTMIGNVDLSHENLANVAGQLLYHTNQGLGGALAQGQADRDSREGLAKFLINIAFDVVPSLDTAEKVVNSVFNQAKGLSKTGILDNIISNDIGVDPSGFDQFYTLLRESIGDPNNPTSTIDPELAIIRRAFEDGLDGPT